jgi:hypothetical protein
VDGKDDPADLDASWRDGIIPTPCGDLSLGNKEGVVMKKWLLIMGLAVLSGAGLETKAQAFVGIGINLGFPCYRPYPYYYGPYPYYYPPPYAVVPSPVYVAPAPTVYQPAPAPVVVTQPTQVLPAPTPVPNAPPARSGYNDPQAQTPAPPMSADIERWLQQLSVSDERVRAEAAIELGRNHADRAVEPLSTMLTTDRSPQVRETAARALGLIGAIRSLNALQQAAQADPDRDVRHSAQFAAEVIRSQLRRN